MAAVSLQRSYAALLSAVWHNAMQSWSKPSYGRARLFQESYVSEASPWQKICVML